MAKNYVLKAQKSMRILLFVLISVLILSYGCKKESMVQNETISQKNEVELVDGRLSFKSESSLKNLLSMLATNKDEDVSKVVNSIIQLPKFVSLSAAINNGSNNSAQNSLSNAQLNSSRGKKMSSTPSFTTLLSSTINRNTTSVYDNSQNELILYAPDELVPDPNFAAILDERLEVMVENTIYKVTPYGTFMIEPESYNRFMIVLDDKPYVDGQSLESDPFYEHRAHDNVYQIEPGVTLIDSYEAANGNINDVMQIQTYPVAYSSTYQYRPDADSWIYEQLPTIQYGGKTWAGKAFESIIGREEIYTSNFEEKRRVKVNFYNISWGVYSSIGISVKMQKKNWIGWSGTAASELRMGWDAMEYYVGDIIPPPAPISVTQQRFTKVDLPKLTKDYVEVDLLAYDLRYDRNTALQQIIKKIHENLPKIAGIKSKTDRDVNYAYKVWNDNTRRSISTILDRDEIVGYNTESLSKVLDWSVGFKVSWDFVGMPVTGYGPLEFKISQASVFGIAKYNNLWKGARIVVAK